ncbi:MAG: sporulation protein YabP [Ruminococcaceae bacterium]|nr:sporulation protein YabP [Oscillospiraceae bacterium]
MESEKKIGEQELRLLDRGRLEVNCVSDVIRFDEDSAVMQTERGLLTVEGAELHVRVLSPETGSVVIDGRIDGIYYGDETENVKKGLLSRLFH